MVGRVKRADLCNRVISFSEGERIEERMR